MPRASRGVLMTFATAAMFAPVALESSAFGAPSARLVYVREPSAERCPDEPALRAAVIARLGYDPFTADSPSTLFATVTRDSVTYRATVKLVDATGQRGARELDHVQCAELVDTMALTISIAIDPESLGAPAPAPPTAPAPAPAPAPPPAPAEGRSPAASASSASPHPFVSITPTLSLGAAPSPAVGLTASLGLDARPFIVALEVRGDLPASRETARGTVSTSFLAGTVAPCVIRSVFLGCALFSAGRIVAEARGITSPRTDSAAHLLGGARVGIALPVTSSLDLRATGDLLFSLTPQVLRIDGADAYEIPRASVQLGIGAALHFF